MITVDVSPTHLIGHVLLAKQLDGHLEVRGGLNGAIRLRRSTLGRGQNDRPGLYEAAAQQREFVDAAACIHMWVL